jgi:lipopolysaccharide biosynthesis glycosyltransferase
MFYLLLESIITYGNLDENTNIFVYTSTSFMNIIKQSHLFNETKIIFEINDTYDSVEKACRARLDLFKLPSVKNYDKILYLDTDILVKDDINKVFNVCKEDILYVLEEGELEYHSEYSNQWWGSRLFEEDELNRYDDKSAFTSGMLLFNNCEKIKDLFDKINEDIIRRPSSLAGIDQPYIIYNAFKYNLFNNKILKAHVVNNDFNIHSDKVVHHFPGGPGVYHHKIDSMTTFLNKLKNKDKLFDTRNEMLQHYCNKLSNPRVLEIGVFKGDFLDYIIKNCNIGCIDAVDLFEGVTCSGNADGNNVEWYDVGKSYLELTEKYKDVPNVNIYKSNSIAFLQNQENDTYDIIYIDGDHSYDSVKNDLLNAYSKIKNGGYIMGHDYEMNMKKAHTNYDFGVKPAVDDFCVQYKQVIISKAIDGCVSFCIQVNKMK